MPLTRYHVLNVPAHKCACQSGIGGTSGNLNPFGEMLVLAPRSRAGCRPPSGLKGAERSKQPFERLGEIILSVEGNPSSDRVETKLKKAAAALSADICARSGEPVELIADGAGIFVLGKAWGQSFLEAKEPELDGSERVSNLVSDARAQRS